MTSATAPSRAVPLAEDLGIVDALVQLSTVVQAVLARSAEDLGLSVLQGRLLGVLRDREPGMSHLSRLLGLDKSSTTGLVDRAERRGLVRRRPVPGDGRALLVELTSEGRRLAGELEVAVARGVGGLTADLTETNRHRLSLLASRVVAGDAARRGVDLAGGRR